MIKLSSASLEYIRYDVTAIVGGSPTYNPTSDTVQFGFTASPSIQPSTWYSGSWETDNTAGTVYIARFLVGPGGTYQVPVGIYSVWICIVDSPEIPVKNPGQLQIY